MPLKSTQLASKNLNQNFQFRFPASALNQRNHKLIEKSRSHLHFFHIYQLLFSVCRTKYRISSAGIRLCNGKNSLQPYNLSFAISNEIEIKFPYRVAVRRQNQKVINVFQSIRQPNLFVSRFTCLELIKQTLKRAGIKIIINNQLIWAG